MTPRIKAWLQLTGVIAVCTLLLPAISPSQAVGGSPVIRLFFLSRMLLLIVLATLLLRARGLTWRDVGLRRLQWWRLGIAVIVGLMSCAVVAALTGIVIHKLGLSAPNYKMFGPLKGDLAEYLFWLIPTSLFSAAFGEEMVFRGFLTNTLSYIMGRRHASWILAVLVQSIIFGALHLYQGLGGAIMAGSIGLVLGFVWLGSGRNLWAGILIHAILDGSAMTVIFLRGPP